MRRVPQAHEGSSGAGAGTHRVVRGIGKSGINALVMGVADSVAVCELELLSRFLNRFPLFCEILEKKTQLFSIESTNGRRILGPKIFGDQKVLQALSSIKTSFAFGFSL